MASLACRVQALKSKRAAWPPHIVNVVGVTVELNSVTVTWSGLSQSYRIYQTLHLDTSRSELASPCFSAHSANASLTRGVFVPKQLREHGPSELASSNIHPISSDHIKGVFALYSIDCKMRARPFGWMLFDIGGVVHHHFSYRNAWSRPSLFKSWANWSVIAGGPQR